MGRLPQPPGSRGVLLACAALLAAGCFSVPIEREPWVEVRTPSFRFVSQIDAARAVQMARDLELFQEVVKRLTTAQNFAPRVRTTILIFRDERSYRPFGPPNSAGGFMPRQRANFATVNAGVEHVDPTAVLMHEYVHYVVQNNSDLAYPAWYNEGLAELLRGMRVVGDQIEVGVVLEDRALTLEHHALLPMQAMMTLANPLSLGPERASVYYAQAWLFMHYLKYGAEVGFPDRAAQLTQYLLLVNQGTSEAEACRRAFGVDFAALQEELESYRKQGQLVGERLPRGEFPAPSRADVRRLSRAEVAGELGTLALQMGDPIRAETFFRSVLASEPDNARAHFGLAESLRARRREGEYDALYARGLELAPDVALNQLDYALYQLARARGPLTEPARRERLEDARAHLRRAIELEPGLPEAHAQLGASYLLFPGEDRREALRSLTRAHQLLSSDVEIDYLLALALYDAGRLGEAELLVTTARERAHGLLDLKRLEQLEVWIRDSRAGRPARRPGDAGPDPN